MADQADGKGKEFSPARPVIQVRPRDKALELAGRRAETELDILLDGAENLVFSIDIYSYSPQDHPANHVGWWHFRLTDGRHRLRLILDFTHIHDKSVRVFEGEAELISPKSWFNPDYALDPLQECKLVFWDARDEVRYLDHLLIKIKEPEVLRAFVGRQHKREGWAPRLPFLHLLHLYKLKILRKYFRQYFRGRVLDIGCGLSLFTEIPEHYPFRVFAGDLDLERMRARKNARPDIVWLVFDASRPPFLPASFDSLFAGEILEHLPEPEEALRAWNRIHKKGGYLILTTPNRRRRVNILNDEDWPVSPDHVREFSFDELNGRTLPDAGYRPVRKKGIYLEVWMRRRFWVSDHLQREGNKKKNTPWMKLFLRLGYLFPRKSLDLISVARKERSV